MVAILVGGVAPHQPSAASDQDARAGRAYIRQESTGQFRIGPTGPADLEILNLGLWLVEAKVFYLNKRKYGKDRYKSLLDVWKVTYGTFSSLSRFSRPLCYHESKLDNVAPN